MGTNNDRRFFPVEVSCPYCHKSLMDPDTPIDGHASIRLMSLFDNKYCEQRMSCLYGSSHAVSENRLPKSKSVTYVCPFCREELVDSFNCIACNARMIYMVVKKGGYLYICANNGCNNHLLDINGDFNTARYTEKIKTLR